MHEMHFIKGLLNDLLSHAKDQQAKKVTKVFLRMGKFTEINEEIVRFFFTENSKGTVAEAAELIIEESPNRELSLLSFDCE